MFKKFSKVLVLVAVMVMVMCGTAFAQYSDMVPKGSWCYDSLAYVTAKGIVGGYEDGTYRPAQPMTRIEFASAIQRAYQKLSEVDETKADKKTVEELQKLMVEFADELKQLGVKVDKIDGRVKVLEDGIGKWQLSGNLTFDVRENSGDNSKGLGTGWSHTPGSSYWGKANAYLNVNKQIDENTQFISQYRFGEWASKYNNDFNKDYGRGDSNSFAVWNFYVKTKLPVFKGTDAYIGRWAFDFEQKAGLVSDANAMFGGGRTDGMRFDKVWNKFDATVLVGRNSSMDYNFYPLVKTKDVIGFDRVNTNAYLFAVNGKYDFNDRFMVGLSAYWNRFDNQLSVGTIGVYARAYLDTQRTMALQGIYYWQGNSDRFDIAESTSKSHSALKGTFSISQDKLKYTSALVEYADFSNSFAGNLGSNYQGMNAYTPFNTANQISLLNNKPLNEQRTNLWFIKFTQKFKKYSKWSLEETFAWADFNTKGVSNTKQWSVGVNYKMSPSVSFLLGYADIDYGDGVTTYKGTTAFGNNELKGHDRCILFRTNIDF